MKKDIAYLIVLVLGLQYALGAYAQSGEVNSRVSELSVDSTSMQISDLEEIVIVAQKEIVKSDGAKLTYDMDADDSSKGQSLLEALRKVPTVTVDGQDNIFIKGSSDFKIYVNGKEDPMLTSNASTMLKAMPAESVSKIEVITDPGAKYDAEGVGGVLNLITERKQRKDGYAGSVTLSGGARDFSGSAFGKMKINNFSADASVQYMNNMLQKSTNISESNLVNPDSEDFYWQLNRQRQRMGLDYIGANLNMAWEPTDCDIVSWGGDMRLMKGDKLNFNSLTQMFTRTGNLKYSFTQLASGFIHNYGASGNVGYRHNFNERGSSLMLGYRFNYGKTALNLDYENTDIYNYFGLSAFENNATEEYEREHTATMDWELHLAENHFLETGAKGIFRRNSAAGERREGDEPGEMIIVPMSETLSSQIQDIYAAYVSYTGTFGNWNIRTGLRYEHTYMGMDFRLGDLKDFRRHLNDIVPNGSVTYSFGPASNLRLSYQMRISRPGINMLNPYRLQILQTFVQIGNPNLSSEKFNSLNLSYSNYGRVFGGNIGIDLSQSSNTIEQYSYVEDGITYYTHANLGHNRKAAINGYFNWNITSRMSASVNGELRYTNIKSGYDDLKNHGWTVNYGINYSYTGPADIRYSAYGGQSTKNYTLQGSRGGWYYYGIGISKGFLPDNQLNLSLNANNFLTKYTDFKNNSYIGSNHLTGWSKNRSWSVSLSVTWRFGKLQERTKTAGVNLENNDKKASSGQGAISM